MFYKIAVGALTLISIWLFFAGIVTILKSSYLAPICGSAVFFILCYLIGNLILEYLGEK